MGVFGLTSFVTRAFAYPIERLRKQLIDAKEGVEEGGGGCGGGGGGGEVAAGDQSGSFPYAPIAAGTTLIVDGTGWAWHVLDTLETTEFSAQRDHLGAYLEIEQAARALLASYLSSGLRLLFVWDGKPTSAEKWAKRKTAKERMEERENKWTRLEGAAAGRSLDGASHLPPVREMPSPPLLVPCVRRVVGALATREEAISSREVTSGEADIEMAVAWTNMKERNEPALCFAQDSDFWSFREVQFVRFTELIPWHRELANAKRVARAFRGTEADAVAASCSLEVGRRNCERTVEANEAAAAAAATGAGAGGGAGGGGVADAAPSLRTVAFARMWSSAAVESQLGLRASELRELCLLQGNDYTRHLDRKLLALEAVKGVEERGRGEGGERGGEEKTQQGCRPISLFEVSELLDLPLPPAGSYVDGTLQLFRAASAFAAAASLGAEDEDGRRLRSPLRLCAAWSEAGDDEKEEDGGGGRGRTEEGGEKARKREEERAEVSWALSFARATCEMDTAALAGMQPGEELEMFAEDEEGGGGGGGGRGEEERKGAGEEGEKREGDEEGRGVGYDYSLHVRVMKIMAWALAPDAFNATAARAATELHTRGGGHVGGGEAHTRMLGLRLRHLVRCRSIPPHRAPPPPPPPPPPLLPRDIRAARMLLPRLCQRQQKGLGLLEQHYASLQTTAAPLISQLHDYHFFAHLLAAARRRAKAAGASEATAVHVDEVAMARGDEEWREAVGVRSGGGIGDKEKEEEEKEGKEGGSEGENLVNLGEGEAQHEDDNNDDNDDDYDDEARALPADSYSSAIFDMCCRATHARVSIIEGETGCGKSSRVPLVIACGEGMEAWEFQMPLSMRRRLRASRSRMFVAQPRRLAASALCRRGREEVGTKVHHGLRLGHGVRDEPGGSRDTRITYCTTGYLVKLLANNPDALCSHSHLVIDEVHERTTDADVLCLLARRAMRRHRSLRLVLMSATMESMIFEDYFAEFGTSRLFIGARRFPVAVFNSGRIPKALLACQVGNTVQIATRH